MSELFNLKKDYEKIFNLIMISFVLFSCTKIENEVNKDKKEINSEIEMRNKLLDIGLSDVDVNTLMTKVIIPNNLLTKNNFNKTNINDGHWVLCDCPGPGHNGPIGDFCKGGGNKCNTSGPIVYVGEEELAIFFPETSREETVDSEGNYPAEHPYPEYLTIVYN